MNFSPIVGVLDAAATGRTRTDGSSTGSDGIDAFDRFVARIGVC